jgi:hypothetical protein
VQLTIRHLTGSRAGQSDVFDDVSEITVGRGPSNMVRFHPEADRLVSTTHAVISREGTRWVLRDLESSNGTWSGPTAVTEKVLYPGETIAFGKGGPTVQIEFESDQVPQTIMAPLDSFAPPAAPPEGQTLRMSLGSVDPAPAVAGSVPPRLVASLPKKKKGGLGRALAVVGGAIVLLLVAGVVLAFAVRSANLKKHAAVRAEAAVEAEQKAVEAKQIDRKLSEEIEKVETGHAALAEATIAPDDAAAKAEIAELQRQLLENQKHVEYLASQLQETNEQLASARQRATSRPAAPPAPPASRPQTAAPRKTAAASPSAAAQATPATVAAAAQQPALPQLSLNSGKRLRKRVSLGAIPPEVPPARMPGNVPRELANLVGAALASTGEYVIGQKGDATINVMITDYRVVDQSSVDVGRGADAARRIGRVGGVSVPTSPVNVQSRSYEAAMAARVQLLDATGRVLVEVQPSAEGAERKTRTTLAGVSFSEVVLSNSIAGDVARKIIGEAVESVRSGLESVEWSTSVTSQRNDMVTLGVGRSSGLEPGDVFEVTDPAGAVTRVRVRVAQEATSEAEFVGPVLKISNRPARFIGTTADVRPLSERTVVIQKKTGVFDGPGESFREIRKLNRGARLRFQYSVGGWARASEGSSTFWVPLANAQVVSN